MRILDEPALATLRENGLRQAGVKGTPAEIDFVPVVKLFTPDANATWLLTELDPNESTLAFGLCDPPSIWWTPMLAFRSWRGVSDECREAPDISGVVQA